MTPLRGCTRKYYWHHHNRCRIVHDMLLAGYGPTLTTEQSVEAMMKLITALSQKQTGKYLMYDGSEMPW